MVGTGRNRAEIVTSTSFERFQLPARMCHVNAIPRSGTARAERSFQHGVHQRKPRPVMGLLIAIAAIWFWSESCFTKQERRTRRRVTWTANGLITAKTMHDLFNIDTSPRR
jgi:hypothetical protein